MIGYDIDGVLTKVGGFPKDYILHRIYGLSSKIHLILQDVGYHLLPELFYQKKV